jgi:hypothetical protein
MPGILNLAKLRANPIAKTMILLASVGCPAGQVRSADQANAMLRIIMVFALDLTFSLAKLRIPFNRIVFRSTTNRGRLIFRITV